MNQARSIWQHALGRLLPCGWLPSAEFVRAQDMRAEREVCRRQAGTPAMQACFVPGQPLVLAAAGGDGAVHLLDLGRPGAAPSAARVALAKP